MTELFNIKDLAVNSIFDDFLKRHPRGVLIGKIFLAWREIVNRIMGADYLKRTEAVRVYEDKLIIKCSDTQTMSDLFLHKEKLLTAYKEQFDPLLFSKLHFVYEGNGAETLTNTPAESHRKNMDVNHPSSELTTELTPRSQANPNQRNPYDTTDTEKVKDFYSADSSTTPAGSSQPSMTRGRSFEQNSNQSSKRSPLHDEKEKQGELNKSNKSNKFDKKSTNPGYRKYISEEELKFYYPDVGIRSAFLDGDDFFE